MTPSESGKTGREEEFTIKLAAISTAALCNTPESFEKTKIERDNPYWTIAYEDVRVAIQREMSLRAELSALRSRHDEMREELEKLRSLRDKFHEAVQLARIAREIIPRAEALLVGFETVFEKKTGEASKSLEGGQG